MKAHRSFLLIGFLLVVSALLFAACQPVEPLTPATEEIVEEATEVPPTETPTEEAVLNSDFVLEIVGPAETVSMSMAELMALPVSEGYAGMKSSTGAITPPRTFTGVALSDLADLVGGVDESIGFNIVAEDGYSITFSYDQIVNGNFVVYDPATGDELKNPVNLTPILAYAVDGGPLDPKEDGTVRLAIISDTLNQVTDGHWAVKWVNKLEAKSLGKEWVLTAHGALDEEIDRASVESCGAPQCHGSAWTDDKAQEWAGVPLWLFVGAVDDEITHEGPAFNDELVEAGYSIEVVAADGYSVPFDAGRVSRNDDIIVAYKVNENPLPDKYFPLRLVGDDLEKSEMVGMIAELIVGLEPLPVTEATEELAEKSDSEEAPAAEVEGTLTVTGLVDEPLGFDEADLREMDVLTITAEHPKNGDQEFEGVSLNALLEMAGVQDGATTLVVTAGDGYSAEVSLAEISACENCLLGFTNTLEKFKMVLPDFGSESWVKEVVNLDVK